MTESGNTNKSKSHKEQSAKAPTVVRFALALTIGILILLAGRIDTSASTAANEYRLGMQDRVRIRVFEWRPAKDEVFEWAALNVEYTVGAAGRISMPLIGEIAASGITVNDLAKTIGQRLRTRMGLAEAPDIAVEITQYRPFYLTGHIEKPGEYPYRPGMTVLQALAIGGGLLRAGEIGGSRIEREFIQTQGDLHLFSQEFHALLARRARLDAESKGKDTLLFPASIRDAHDETGMIATLITQEQQIFRSKRETFDNQTDTHEQLLQFLSEEIKSIEQQLKAHDTQADLLRKELEAVSALVAKGISTQPRKMALQRAIAQMDGERSRLQTGLMRVKQDQSRTNISLLELHNKRINDSVAELRDVQFRLESIARRSETAERLLGETQRIAPFVLAANLANQKREPIYKIVRASASTPTTIDATETTTIEPGDTLKVEFPRNQILIPNMFVNAPGSKPLNPATEDQPEKIRAKTNEQKAQQSTINRRFIPSSTQAQ